MIRTIVERLDRWITYASLLTTAVLMLLTSADALGRYFFDQPIEGAFQISEDYLLVLGVFLAINLVASSLGQSLQAGAGIKSGDRHP